MNLLFGTDKVEFGKGVSNTRGLCKCIGIMSDLGNIIIVTYDKSTETFNISRIKNKMEADMIDAKNMEKIEDDSEWQAYLSFFKLNGIIPID